MLSFTATVLLGAPLLAAAASEVVPSRVQRRAALLELLQHQHETRAESYDTTDLCDAQPASNDADYTQLQAGASFPEAVYSFTYTSNCQSERNCQQACIEDADMCIGYTYDTACSVFGDSSYGGDMITTVPSGFFLLQNAGSSSDNGEHPPTCASMATGDNALDMVSTSNGACECGRGRTRGDSTFNCMADAVPAAAYPQEPKTLEGPVTSVTPFTWSASIQAVPAVMDINQCEAICLADGSDCGGFILRQGDSINKCWKIGGAGVYSSPANDDPSVNSAVMRMVKRQAAGTVGSFGASGDVFGQPAGSSLVTDAFPAASGVARRRVKRSNHTQW